MLSKSRVLPQLFFLNVTFSLHVAHPLPVDKPRRPEHRRPGVQGTDPTQRLHRAAAAGLGAEVEGRLQRFTNVKLLLSWQLTAPSQRGLELNNVIATPHCTGSWVEPSLASKMIGAYHCVADATA